MSTCWRYASSANAVSQAAIHSRKAPSFHMLHSRTTAKQCYPHYDHYLNCSITGSRNHHASQSPPTPDHKLRRTGLSLHLRSITTSHANGQETGRCRHKTSALTHHPRSAYFGVHPLPSYYSTSTTATPHSHNISAQ
jgi:hypothetical protein